MEERQLVIEVNYFSFTYKEYNDNDYGTGDIYDL